MVAITLTLAEQAARYAAAGLLVLPLHHVSDGKCSCSAGAECGSPGKHPRWHRDDLANGLIDATSDAATIRRWWQRWEDAGVAVVSVEGLDFDNKGHPGADELLSTWREIVSVEAPGLADRLLCERTPSGGYHLVWRCSTIEGNQKLAERQPTAAELEAEPKLRSVTLVETRGKGGYLAVAPSPGYELLSGDWAALPEITPAERAICLKAARMLDKMPAPQRATGYTPAEALNGLKPGADYDQRATDHDVLRLLEGAGWSYQFTRGDNHILSRPGKPRGTSATLRNDGTFYVFSSNAAPFEPSGAGQKPYSPFGVYALTQHGGDFKAAARDLARQGYGDQTPAQGQARPVTAGDITLEAEQVEALNALNKTDQGNAEALAALYGDELRYCHSRKKWLIWTGSRWRIDEDGRADRAMVAVARRRYVAAASIDDLEARKRAAAWAIGSENSGKIEAALTRAGKLEAFTSTIDRYDADPLLAATPTATLDLKAGAARAPARDDFLTMSLGVSFDAGAECPRWRRFLVEVFNGDQELIGYLQRAVGYCLTGDTSEQKVFLCYGAGANGKSTFLEVLTWLLGDYAANASFDTFDAGRRSDATNDLAALKGRRLVTVIETEEDRRLAEARVKAVTGGDLVTARFLYGEYFSYRPQFKIWLAMNHKPQIRGTDRGIWRRLQLVPFAQSFEGKEDRTLRATLRAELPGILNWALEGLRAWHAQGLGQSEAVAAATREYQEESDQVGRWLADNTVAGRTFTAQASTAYADYVRWCEASGERAFSQTMWGRRLSERGITRERARGGWQLVGFGLMARQVDDSAPPPAPEPPPSPAATPARDPFDLFDPNCGEVPIEDFSTRTFPQNRSNRSNGSQPAEVAADPAAEQAPVTRHPDGGPVPAVEAEAAADIDGLIARLAAARNGGAL